MPWRLSSLAAVLFAWLLFPRIASAHAELLGSDPPAGSSMERSPTELRLFFSEPVTPGLTELSLIDERGRRVDRGTGQIDSENGRVLSAMVDELPPGVYTLSYRALSSIDGHIDRGVITFAIGTTDSIPPQSATEILGQQDFWTSGSLRWMSYLAVLLLLGLPAFRVFVAGSSRAGLSSTQLAALDTRLTRLLLCSAITLAISSLGQIVEQSFQLADSGSLGGVLAAAESLVVRTRYGGIWLGRLVLAAAVAGVLRGHLQVSAAERTQRWGGAVILAVLTLYTFATLSHASSALDASWIGLVLSWVHLISISVWLGGLAGLLLSASLGVSARLAAAFRGIATGSVAMILISGIGQSLLLVGDVRALTQTLHGQLLLLKLVAVLGAVVVAWQVRQIALARARSGLHALPRLIAQLRLEFGLGATALGLTALLVYLPPAWQTYRQQLRARPTDAETIVHDLKWSTRIQPGRPGENELTLSPPAELRGRIDFGRLLATSQDPDLPPVGARLEPDDSGVLRTRTQILSVAGRWLLESVVRLDSGDDVLVRIPIELEAPGAPLPPPPLLHGGTVTASVIVSLALVSLGSGMLLFVVWSLGTRTREARGLIAATVAIVLLGGYVSMRPAPSEALNARGPRGAMSPLPATAESVERGRIIFESSCAECHGASGRGDGPRNERRGDWLTDLRVHLSAGHTDGDLYEWISEGIDGTEMPGFASQLSDDDRWHVVNAIRSIAAEPAP